MLFNNTLTNILATNSKHYILELLRSQIKKNRARKEAAGEGEEPGKEGEEDWFSEVKGAGAEEETKEECQNQEAAATGGFQIAAGTHAIGDVVSTSSTFSISGVLQSHSYSILYQSI